MNDNNISLGLCCHNIHLRYDEGIYTGRTLKLKTVKDKGIAYLIEIANKNINDLMKILKWCALHGIFVYRISSDLIPHGSNLSLMDIEGGSEYLSLEVFRNILKKVGKKIIKYGIRVTFHPGQYVQLSGSDEIYKKSEFDLMMHAKILEYMNCDRNSVMVIHGGGTYKDKISAIQKFEKRLINLPDLIKKRIVLENDEKSYSPDDLLPICLRHNIPFVFDIFHYKCYSEYHGETSQKSISDIMPDILLTWKLRDIKPKFHLSEQGTGKRGAHSTFIKTIPDVFMTIYKKYGVKIDIMIEAKGKELAISKLYAKYPFLLSKYYLPISDIIPHKALKDIKQMNC